MKIDEILKVKIINPTFCVKTRDVASARRRLLRKGGDKIYLSRDKFFYEVMRYQLAYQGLTETEKYNLG